MTYQLDTPMQLAKIDSPSRNQSSVLSRNEVLRAHGFVIKARPRNGEPIWENGGVEIGEAAALWICQECGK